MQRVVADEVGGTGPVGGVAPIQVGPPAVLRVALALQEENAQLVALADSLRGDGGEPGFQKGERGGGVVDDDQCVAVQRPVDKVLGGVEARQLLAAGEAGGPALGFRSFAGFDGKPGLARPGDAGEAQHRNGLRRSTPFGQLAALGCAADEGRCPYVGAQQIDGCLRLLPALVQPAQR